MIYGLGLLVAGILWLARFLKGRERRDLVFRLQDDNRSLLVLLEQLQTYLSGNPYLPSDGLRSLDFRLAAMKPLHDRFTLLKSADLRRGLPDWFDAMDRVLKDGDALQGLNAEMHDAPDFRDYLEPLKLAQNALREHLARTLEETRTIRTQLAAERYGWRRRIAKDEPISVPDAPWPKAESRSMRIRTTGVITGAYATGSPQDPVSQEKVARIRYSSKRFLDRVVAAVGVAGSGSTGTEISTSHLDEIEQATKDFESGAADLHLLPDTLLRDDLSAFAVRLRHEVGGVRKSEAAVAESWARAHAKQKERPHDLDYWFKTLVPPASEFSNRTRSAAIERVRAWGATARQLLQRLSEPGDEPAAT